MRGLLKPVLLTTLLIIITLSSFAQDPFSPYNEIKPKGKIDSVIIMAGNADGKHVYIYNRRRQLVEVTQYIDEVINSGGGRYLDTVKTQFNYGANGRLLSGVMIVKGGKKSTVRYEYLTKKSGYTIRVSDSRDVDFSIVSEMRFNPLGQIIQCGYYALNNLEQQIPGNFDYKYNKKGYLIEKTTYYAYHVPPGKVFYTYNNDGDMIAENNENPTDGRNSTYSYPKYDQMHNWTERDFLNGNGFQHTAYRRITYYK